MLSRVISTATSGINAYLIDVEVDISKGLPSFSTVGLPDAAVKESKNRVIAAIKNSGYDIPSRKVTVNLAPADIKKEGVSFDLPIAVGILSAIEQIKSDSIRDFCLIGELALDGSLRPVKGVLPIVLNLKENGKNKIILPEANIVEASVAEGLEIYPARTLKEVIKFLNDEEIIPCFKGNRAFGSEKINEFEIDFSEVKGQQFAKRALEIAAAGGHNLVMIGPPGSGKTMLAKRLPSILPALSFQEAIETTKIHSVAGLMHKAEGLVNKRPFRAPHHTVSNIAMVGGGSYPKPGEVSLSHNGVLFLDEFTEFHRDVLEVLRQPLEDRVVTVSRAKQALIFPASFMLLAAMNPCPCGNLGHSAKECLCTPYQIQKYRSKISGPLMDRIDLHLEVPSVKIDELTDESQKPESSKLIRSRVNAAREIQKERFLDLNIFCNAQMNSKYIKKYCVLKKEGKEILKNIMEKLNLSARAYDRILKVARTIADLESRDSIEASHLAEAIQYRSLDRVN